MNIEQKFTTANPCYKNAIKINVRGLMLHSVGCSQPKASAFFNQFNKSNVSKAVHAFVQADGYVMQTLPWNIKAWHCGGSGNNSYIGVEMTEPSTIKYVSGSSWQDLNPAATKQHVLGTYNTAVELFAKLCKDYGLNPLGKNVIICHQDGARLGIASNHADVYHIWKAYGLTMDKFRQDVNAKLNGQSTPASNPTPAPVQPASSSTVNSFYKVVNLTAGDHLNIRQQANGSSAVIGKLSNGYMVYVDTITNGWAHLQQGGYVSTKYIKQFNNGYSYVPKRYSATVTADVLNVRELPNTSSKIVGKVKKGQTFTIVGTCNGFGMLLSGAGNISTNYVKLKAL